MDIEHGYANLHVTDFDVDDTPIYLFTQAGSYLGRMQRTNMEGKAAFLVPTGAYKFRVDYSGTQYWSDVVNILAGDETAVDLALDLLALDDTRNPHPKRFDGVPPELDPIMLASLMDITGILNQSVVAATGPDALCWYVNDHLGTPQRVIDSDKVVIWEGSQEPFGNTTVSINTLGNDFRFPGQQFDNESNLHYNYYRYYDPSIGRYIKPDPIGLNGGINLFGYANSNPINNFDFYGLKDCKIIGINGLGEAIGNSQIDEEKIGYYKALGRKSIYEIGSKFTKYFPPIPDEAISHIDFFKYRVRYTVHEARLVIIKDFYVCYDKCGNEISREYIGNSNFGKKVQSIIKSFEVDKYIGDPNHYNRRPVDDPLIIRE